MRSLSGTRNRIVLVLAGAATLVAAAWLIAVAFGLVTPGSWAGGLVMPGDSTVGTVVQERRGWLLPAALVAVVLAVIAGIGLLFAQIPTAPAHTVLRFHDDDGTVLASLEPQVLERALEERLDEVPGVLESSLRVSGSTTALQVQGEVTVPDTAEVGWVVAEARRLLVADLEAAVGIAPRAIDLLVRLSSSGSADRDRVAVRQPGEGGTLVSAGS